MEIFKLTRELIDLESVTWNEGAVGRFLCDYLTGAGFAVTMQEVTAGRFNVYARVGDPLVVLSTHMDTVPPFIPSSEDEQKIHGRGACDTKGLLAAMIFAAKKLRAEGLSDLGLLFVVGEEDGSDGAKKANELPNRCRFLINGEPTENCQGIATKGTLRVVIEAGGRTAHAAYPEFGESAIEKLLDILSDIRRREWPTDELLGATTCNIGTISGGHKANVVPDQAAAELMFRTVNQPDEMFDLIKEAVGDRARVVRGFSLVPIHLRTIKEFADIPTGVMRFGTDIPSLTNWGEALLFGPGSIHHAHTPHEFIAKDELLQAVDTYARMARALLATP